MLPTLLTNETRSCTVLVIFHECPELLQSVQLARLVVSECLSLEVPVEVRAEFLLKAVTVESEQTLETVSATRNISVEI